MEKLEAALVQSSLFWENPEKNRIHFSNVINSIPHKVDLIVLPEMFTTGFTMNPQKIDPIEGKKTIEWMQGIAKLKNTAITGSCPFFNGKDYLNRLFFVYPNGEYVHYDKKHTFTLAGEDKVYSSGNSRLILDYKGFKICPLICYDLRFPVWARNTEDYDVLLYVANWPKPRIGAWDTLLKARAIENMAYVIGVNRIGEDASKNKYNGHSAAYDTLGEQLVFSEKEEVLFATLNKDHIQKTRNKLKFLEDRDLFTL